MNKDRSIEFLYEVVFFDSDWEEKSAFVWAKGFFEAEYLAKQAYASELVQHKLAVKSISVAMSSFEVYAHNKVG